MGCLFCSGFVSVRNFILLRWTRMLITFHDCAQACIFMYGARSLRWGELDCVVPRLTKYPGPYIRCNSPKGRDLELLAASPRLCPSLQIHLPVPLDRDTPAPISQHHGSTAAGGTVHPSRGGIRGKRSTDPPSLLTVPGDHPLTHLGSVRAMSRQPFLPQLPRPVTVL